MLQSAKRLRDVVCLLRNWISEKASMKNAYECKEQFGADGRRLKRERAVGPIVPWCIVVLVAILLGQALDIPAVAWKLFRP